MRRYVLILGLLIAGSASAQAATLHRHDSGHHVFIGPELASSFDAVPGWAEAPRPLIRHDDVASYNDRWDPWGHLGAYYGPMTSPL
jgi:hypothetical protein